jgi:hypothetical protein
MANGSKQAILKASGHYQKNDLENAIHEVGSSIPPGSTNPCIPSLLCAPLILERAPRGTHLLRERCPT